MSTIGILGAGTWGVALARMLTNCGNDVTVWSAIESEIDELSSTRKQKNLPEMKIPEGTKFTKEIETVCKNKDILLFAVPSLFVRTTARIANPYIPTNQIIVDVAKGIEPETLLTLTQVIQDEIDKPVRMVALSGPTHAEEVAKDTFVMGDDWKGKFDFLKEEGIEVVYLPRTPDISSSQMKKNLHDSDDVDGESKIIHDDIDTDPN